MQSLMNDIYYYEFLFTSFDVHRNYFYFEHYMMLIIQATDAELQSVLVIK